MLRFLLAAACAALAAAAAAVPGTAEDSAPSSVSADDAAAQKVFDAYMTRHEPVYKWRDTGHRVTKLLFGGQATILNVTSLTWLDEERAVGPTGAVWTHQVAVVVPKKLTTTNVSMAVLNGGCNEDHYHNGTGPAPPDATDEYLALADALAYNTGAIAIVVYQLPNCRIVYPSDPQQTPREEDAMIAWAWYEYIQDPKHDPEWLPRLPMAKAGFQCMRAVQEWTAQEKLADIKGWIVAGASKRGWTTWMVGAADCPTCVNIVGIAPLVPIVPDLVNEIHRQWMSYGGFTWAFTDYLAVNFTQLLDGPQFASALQIIDPMYYYERLARLPKVIVLSSDDEFMQFDWSDIWYDDLLGEKHLLIPPNSEHSLATGIPEIIECMTAFFSSVAHGQTAAERPSFDYAYDNTTGALSVSFPPGVEHGKVVLRHAQSMSTTRRDFRWVRLANNETGKCSLPGVKIPPLSEGGGNCVQPIIWLGKTLQPDAKGVYSATPPEPKPGHWTGYYIEVFFPSGTAVKSEFQFTTPGYAWPNTLPFKDCTGSECIGRKV